MVDYSDFDSQDALIVQMVYDYNEDGELISESRTDGSGQTKTNVYSATQRLTEQQVTENGQPVSAFGYTYDAGGNITSATQNGQTDTYTYTSANRIETYNGLAVQHDGDGNITEATIDGVLTSFTFDVRNRLASAGDLTFEYDLENRRIQKQDGSQTTTYVQNPNAPLPQVLMKSTGGTTTHYIYGQGLIAEETGTAYWTYHYDYRGSTIALTGNDGLVTDTYAYGPYGELLNHTGTSQVDYLYNGRDGVITDSEDLYYMRARYYSTDLKRFLSEDAFAGKYDNLLGLNLYGYVNGNPVQYMDPSGYERYRQDHMDEALKQAAYYYQTAGGSTVQSTIISFIPLLGDFKDVQETILGIDLVTGEALTLGERGVTAVCAFIPILSGKGANGAMDAFNAFSKGGSELAFKTGKAGEEYLAKLVGGESQVYFKTSQGGRYIDQLAGDIAYESKVGYTSLTEFAKKQILKDAELIEQGLIKGANWNFFKSDVTGKVGASKPLLEFLEQHGITYTIHK